MPKDYTKVLTLAGKPINWKNPPKPNAMVLWSKKTTGGKPFKCSFWMACAMVRADNRAHKRFGKGIEVLQAPNNSTVKASAGTHDKDCILDAYIPGVGWWDQQRFFRGLGFMWWYRHPPEFGNHGHGGPLPPWRGDTRSEDYRACGLTVGLYVDGGVSTRGSKVASSQIDDYYAHALGLSGQHAKGSDRSWFPPDIRETIFSFKDLEAFVAARAA